MTEGLFEIIKEPSAPDLPTRVRFEVEELDVRGPGLRPTPTEGRAPDWWQVEAERVLLELAARPGGVTADELREAFPWPASSSNAAVGSLFRRLAQQGRIALVGYERSTRTANRGRVTGRWCR